MGASPDNYLFFMEKMTHTNSVSLIRSSVMWWKEFTQVESFQDKMTEKGLIKNNLQAFGISEFHCKNRIDLA